MRTLSLSGLACVVALIVVTPNLAKSQPSVSSLTFGQTSAGGVEEVGYRYRRYRYARPYGYGYRSYGYYRPYGYYGGYGYPYWRRPGLSFGFSF